MSCCSLQHVQASTCSTASSIGEECLRKRSVPSRGSVWLRVVSAVSWSQRALLTNHETALTTRSHTLPRDGTDTQHRTTILCQWHVSWHQTNGFSQRPSGSRSSAWSWSTV